MNSWKKESVDGVTGFLFPMCVFLCVARNLVLLSFLDPGVSGAWPGRSGSGVGRQRWLCGKAGV